MSSIVFSNSNEKSEMLRGYRDLLTTQDLSEILGISKQTVYCEIRSGKFGEPLKFGREYRISKLYLIEKYIHGNSA